MGEWSSGSGGAEGCLLQAIPHGMMIRCTSQPWSLLRSLGSVPRVSSGGTFWGAVEGSQEWIKFEFEQGLEIEMEFELEFQLERKLESNVGR